MTKGTMLTIIFKKIQQEEDERAAFQQICYVLQPTRSGVNRVGIENKGGSRWIVSDKEEMEAEIAQGNVEKLLQANNTLLRKEPLCSWFGEEGDFDRWDQIVDGKIGLPPNFEAEEGTRLWLKNTKHLNLRRKNRMVNGGICQKLVKNERDHHISSGPSLQSFQSSIGSQCCSKNLFYFGIDPTSFWLYTKGMVPIGCRYGT